MYTPQMCNICVCFTIYLATNSTCLDAMMLCLLLSKYRPRYLRGCHVGSSCSEGKDLNKSYVLVSLHNFQNLIRRFYVRISLNRWISIIYENELNVRRWRDLQ
jgi:hypothetical protein